MDTILLNQLKNIIKLSDDIFYTANGWSATFSAVDDHRINEFFSIIEDCSQEVRIRSDELEVIDADSVTVGKSYSYNLTVVINEAKNNFFSTPDELIKFLLKQFDDIDWQDKIVLPFEKDVYPEVAIYKKHFQLINRLLVIFSKNTYVDKNRNSFVLFTTKPVLIPLIINTKFDKIKNLFDKFDSDSFGACIESIDEFLKNETNDIHKKERKSIFIMEAANIIETYEEGNRFFILIENIKKVSESIESSYQAYLNNFSYKKLELELKKDLDYFIKSINDSLGSLQNQALGLPIAGALTQLSKNVPTTVTYICLILFCFFIAFNAFQQQKQVEYINLSIGRFYDNDNVKPVVEKDKALQRLKDILNSRLRYIGYYIKTIYVVSGIMIIISLGVLACQSFVASPQDHNPKHTSEIGTL